MELMKIILSRKGFDSASGGLCNPILPDGTLLSMPIPGTSKNPVYYKDLHFDVERCSGCPLLQGGGNGRGADCLFDVPVKQGKRLEIPYTPRNRFAFYEILIQKGIVQRKNNSWDLV